MTGRKVLTTNPIQIKTNINTSHLGPYMKEGPVLVTAAIIPREGKVLIAQRHPTSRFEPNRWEFPGGKVDHGEHPEGSLKRELLEELGINVEIGPLYEVLSHVYDNNGDIRHVVLLFYICDIGKDLPQTVDCQDLVWVGRNEISRYQFVEGDIPLVRTLSDDPGIWKVRS